MQARGRSACMPLGLLCSSGKCIGDEPTCCIILKFEEQEMEVLKIILNNIDSG
jgi:hypothetical protein